MNPVNLENAIAAHSRWKMKFRAVIAGTEVLDPATLHKDGCELGQWLCGEGRTLYSGKPEFTALVKWHDAFHVEAAKVANAIKRKQFGKARQMISPGTAFSQASSAINISVNSLKKSVAG